MVGGSRGGARLHPRHGRGPRQHPPLPHRARRHAGRLHPGLVRGRQPGPGRGIPLGRRAAARRRRRRPQHRRRCAPLAGRRLRRARGLHPPAPRRGPPHHRHRPRPRERPRGARLREGGVPAGSPSRGADRRRADHAVSPDKDDTTSSPGPTPRHRSREPVRGGHLWVRFLEDPLPRWTAALAALARGPLIRAGAGWEGLHGRGRIGGRAGRRRGGHPERGAGGAAVLPRRSPQGQRDGLPSEDEPFELFRGFSEIFITVGLVLIFLGIEGLGAGDCSASGRRRRLEGL